MNKIITIAACLTLMAPLHAQTTIFVKPEGTGDGTSWANACNLEEAVTERSRSAETTEIWVQSGTYNPSKMLVISDSVKIYGGFTGVETNLSQRNFSANSTIIDGQQKIGSVFRLENSAEINGFTIQNGNANGNSQKNGGGVWADENSVIANCKIINNIATLNGGGVYANGKVKFINNTIENNIANGSGNNLFGNCITVVTHCENTGISELPKVVSTCNNQTPNWGNSLGTIISFASANTWFVANQEWSDAVQTTECSKKTVFDGGVPDNYNADCRNNPEQKGNLFSWCAVTRYADVLCPAPWRVPTEDDIRILNSAMGSQDLAKCANYFNANAVANYINLWGGTTAGRCYENGLLDGQNYYIGSWSQSEATTPDRALISFHNLGNGHSIPLGCYPKNYGFPLRCVR